MTYHLPNILKWGLTLAFLAWSCVLTVVILGEDSFDMPMSFFEFFLIKAMAIGSAYATYKAANWCYVRDMFPQYVRTCIEKCEKEEDVL